jgi:hypothetical protein
MNLPFCLRKLVLRYERLQHIEHVVPECLMVLVQKDNKTGRLGVEAGRNVKDDLFDEISNLLVGDGSLLVELVVCAALLDGAEEGL